MYLQGLARSRLDRVGSVLAEAIGLNPKLHFTTDSFVFVPDSAQDRAIFTRDARLKGWMVRDTEGRLETQTGNLSSILEQGLKNGSCVATIPSGYSESLVTAHPRLMLEAFRKTIARFGKHSLPHKQSPIQKTNGVIEDVTGALIVIGDHVSGREKGQDERVELRDCNLLKARTHIIGEVTPSDILAAIPFQISQSIPSRRGIIRPHTSGLVDDVFRGIREAIKARSMNHGDGQAQALRYATMLSCFRPSPLV